MTVAFGIGLSRRCCLASTAMGLLALAGMRARAHESAGPVQPARPAPAVGLTDQDGRRLTLPQLLLGKRSAMQLVFTGCSTVCPLQGAVFAQVQARLTQRPLDGAQLLSLSIDPLGDTPTALRAWLARFGAQAHWIAAVPALSDVDHLQRALAEVQPDALDRHSNQVFFFDRTAKLAWRSTELPSALEVEQALRQLG